MKRDINIIRNNKAFTLVEVLVSMTILAIVMVSILMIYALSVQISMKADLNREMQQNIKSVVETLAEDVRKNWITAVSSDKSDSFGTGSKVGDSMILGDKQYVLIEYTNIQSDNFQRINIADCTDIKKVCALAKVDFVNWKIIWPLTNSKISFTNLEFWVTQGAIPKVTINMSVRAAIKNGVRPDLIKSSVIHFQTTISERSLQVK